MSKKDKPKEKKSRKKKDPSPPSNVVEVPPPALTDDKRKFLDASMEIVDAFQETPIKGYAIYVWAEGEEGDMFDMVAYSRGDVHPYLFPEVVKKALERFM